MKVVAMIPARYAASRFHAKLMQDLGGNPVIVQTYKATLATTIFDDVYVVTDSDIIRDAVKAVGGKVMISKSEHQSGSDRIAEAAKHMDIDIVINVQGDEPFVNRCILEEIIDVLKNDTTQEIDLVSAMQVLEDKDKINNPDYVKVVVDNQSRALYFSRSPIPFLREKGSSAPYYEHIGIYGFRKKALIDFAESSMTPLEMSEKIECIRFLEYGKTIKMVATNYMGIEIDTLEDLERANFFIKQNPI